MEPYHGATYDNGRILLKIYPYIYVLVFLLNPTKALLMIAVKKLFLFLTKKLEEIISRINYYHTFCRFCHCEYVIFTVI